MKIAFLCAAFSFGFTMLAFAADHNNVDAGSPLNFDDAEAIAQGERTLELGGSLSVPRRGKVGVAGSVELLYGLRNSQVGVDLDPRYTTESGMRRGDVGDVGVSYLHNFNREYGNVPAFAVRADAYLPTGRDSRGVDFRLRGIASRQFRQYDRLHLNLDLNLDNRASAAQRRFQPGVIVGYSHPLGYPTRFDRTLVAEVGFRANEDKNAGGLATVGIGVRQQISVRSVMDLGLSGELSGGPNREKLRLAVGYSTAF